MSARPILVPNTLTKYSKPKINLLPLSTTTPPSFSKKVDFTSAIFNNVLNFSGVKNIDIDLKHVIIDRIEYGNVEFKSDNRETFLTLKNVALKPQ
jgi:hypothetical protein